MSPSQSRSPSPPQPKKGTLDGWVKKITREEMLEQNSIDLEASNAEYRKPREGKSKIAPANAVIVSRPINPKQVRANEIPPIRMDRPTRISNKKREERERRIREAGAVANKKKLKELPLRQRRERRNWFKPEIWGGIEAAQKMADSWEPTMILRVLLRSPATRAIYGTLARGTIWRWISREETRGWKPEIIQKVNEWKDRAVKKPLGRPKILSGHPHVLDAIVRQLRQLRASGVAVSQTLARSVFLVYIGSLAPELRSTAPRFKCCEDFVRTFLHSQLDWSYRTVTQAAQKRPEDWESKCNDAFLRIAYWVRLHRIPAELIINADQTGVSVLPTSKKTWAERGAKQVAAVGKDEKRQMTLMSIWAGSTKKSLPSEKVRREAERDGHQWVSGGEKHWSTLATMKAPYIARTLQQLGLKSTQKVLLILDCWTVHRSAEFLDWMRNTQKNLKMVFIPGGCTGDFQPQDVGTQRLVKHIIKTSALDYIVNETKKQLDSGASPESVSIPTGLPILREASVAWTLKAFKFFTKNPDVVLRSWAQCKTDKWDLSYKTITSEQALTALDERLEAEPAFAASLGIADAESDANVEGREFDDDTAIPVEDLVGLHLHGDQVPGVRVEDGDFLLEMREEEEEFEPELEEDYGVGKKAGSVDESEEPSEGESSNVEMSEGSDDRDGSVSDEDSDVARDAWLHATDDSDIELLGEEPDYIEISD
ncbi:hypothetical protein FRC00_001650 [Tulasnella sp. 408]|nr:hypothetical protein FRC00_001650 [Tulasnella sp. 408]